MNRENSNVIQKTPVGIEGFDTITGGGLPAGRVTLALGSSGSGKTIFGMQFLVHGISKQSEPGVFLSFEEKKEDLLLNFNSLGIDLKELCDDGKLTIDFVDPSPGVRVEAGDYELEGLLARLEYAIDEVGARRVVIDSLPVLFQSFSDMRTIRATLFRLFNWLKERSITVIVTGQESAGLIRDGFTGSLTDCIVRLSVHTQERTATRYIQVVKYRGSAHQTDAFPFLISERGISVLPITSIRPQYEASSEHVSSGIPNLDTMLGGKGYFKGSSVLVSGEAGTGKTSVGAYLAVDCCKRGKRCLYFAFEESENEIIRNMRSIGLDLEKWIGNGHLEFIVSRSSQYNLEQQLVEIDDEVKHSSADTVIIDPISNLAVGRSPTDVKSMTSRLLDLLKSRGVTALFTALTGAESRTPESVVGISSVVDTWITLRNWETNGEQTRIMRIVKSRGMAHSNQLREFLINDGGIDLVEVYTGPEGILTGAARSAAEENRKEEHRRRRREIERRERDEEYRQAAIEAQIASLQNELEKSREEVTWIRSEADEHERYLATQREEIARRRRVNPDNTDREDR